MKFRYQKEVNNLVKLIDDYWIEKKISKKELNFNFSFTESASIAEMSGSWAVTSIVITFVFLSTWQLMSFSIDVAISYCSLEGSKALF